MQTDFRAFLNYVLTDILPQTGVVAQQGGAWKITREFPAAVAINNRTFSTQDDVVNAITDHYLKQGQARGMITQVGGDQLRKAV